MFPVSSFWFMVSRLWFLHQQDSKNYKPETKNQKLIEFVQLHPQVFEHAPIRTQERYGDANDQQADEQ